jgi:hypothetical protein
MKDALFTILIILGFILFFTGFVYSWTLLIPDHMKQ